MVGYNYILFDLDGTITDPRIGITKSIAYALEYYGVKIEDLNSLCKFIGLPLRNLFTEHYSFSQEDAEIAVQKYREYFVETGLYENIVYKGIKVLLKDLYDRRKTLVLATSKPTVYAKRILKHFDLIDYFSFVSGSELNGERSVKAEVISYALEEIKIENLQKIIMVGDREYDIIGAKKIGIDSIGVSYGFGSKKELENAGAAFIAESVEMIGKILI